MKTTKRGITNDEVCNQKKKAAKCDHTQSSSSVGSLYYGVGESPLWLLVNGRGEDSVKVQI